MTNSDVEANRWSDAIISYVPLQQAWAKVHDGEASQIEGETNEALTAFLQVNPECPFSGTWLFKEFVRRVLR